MTGEPARTRRLDGVQILRAAAAIMVVLLHAQTMLALQGEAHGLMMPRFTALPLGAGVDLFFVISGFIIVYASERLFGAAGGAATFLKRRLLRIVPLYWFALSLRIAMLAAGAAAGHAASTGYTAVPGFAAVAASYLFIPYDTLGFGPDFLFPILDLGWSLNYEMLFYLAFAAAMVLARMTAGPSLGTMALRERAGLIAVGALAACVLAAWLHPPTLDQLRFWFRPMVLEFAAGIGLALLFRRGVRVGRAAGIGLCALGIGLWAGIDLAWFDRMDVPGLYGWSRTLAWGGGAALIFAGLVLGPFRFDNPLAQRVALIGDASYALYLLHPFVFRAAKTVLSRLPLEAALLWPLTLLVVAVSIGATLAFHRLVEEPFLRWLQGRAPAQPGLSRVPADA